MTATAPTAERCVLEKNKRIFATKAEVEEFEKDNREKYSIAQQYAYHCPHNDHWHLSSSPGYVEGAPQIKTTDWAKTKAWQVVDPELRTTRADKIVAALKRHNGTKSVKEIAIECGVPNTQLAVIYDLAKEHDLPYLTKRGRIAPQPPVLTLATVKSRRERLEAELRQMDELEKDILRQEEEKKRVTVKISSNGATRTNMIFAWANGTGLWLDVAQANSLFSQLPAVIDEMRTRASSGTGEQ